MDTVSKCFKAVWKERNVQFAWLAWLTSHSIPLQAFGKKCRSFLAKLFPPRYLAAFDYRALWHCFTFEPTRRCIICIYKCMYVYIYTHRRLMMVIYAYLLQLSYLLSTSIVFVTSSWSFPPHFSASPCWMRADLSCIDSSSAVWSRWWRDRAARSACQTVKIGKWIRNIQVLRDLMALDALEISWVTQCASINIVQLETKRKKGGNLLLQLCQAAVHYLTRQREQWVRS